MEFVTTDEIIDHGDVVSVVDCNPVTRIWPRPGKCFKNGWECLTVEIVTLVTSHGRLPGMIAYWQSGLIDRSQAVAVRDLPEAVRIARGEIEAVREEKS